MSLRTPAGFIRPGYDPLKVPNAPTIGTATGGDAQASVAFTAPSNTGGSAITQYTAVSTPGGLYAQGSSSPLSVTGLTNGTAYTFTVWALNTYGPSPYSAASGSATPAAPTAVYPTGYLNTTGFTTASIQSFNMSTAGNAAVFGNLTVGRTNIGSCGSGSRAVFAGGGTPSAINVIDYATYSSLGDATDFGDTTSATSFTAASSNSVRAIIQIYAGILADNTITIASTGNAVSFGGTMPNNVNAGYGQCAVASPTQAFYGGGDSSTYQYNIYYTTIAATGTWTNFGSLSVGRRYPATGGSATRGLFMGGQNASSGTGYNVIDYITYASAGNATDFGDLTQIVNSSAGTSSATRTFRIAGNANTGLTNVIDYVVTATTGNSTDFGDAAANAYMCRGTSNSHGGLQ